MNHYLCLLILYYLIFFSRIIILCKQIIASTFSFQFNKAVTFYDKSKFSIINIIVATIIITSGFFVLTLEVLFAIKPEMNAEIKGTNTVFEKINSKIS